MTNILFLVLFVALASCGPSAEELAKRQQAADEAARVAAQAEAADAAKVAQEQAEAEAAADAAEMERARTVTRHFPEAPNAIEACVKKKGAPVKRLMAFGSPASLAYKLQLGDALARRFSPYVDRAADCTAYGRTALERALIPALSVVQNTRQLGTLVAVAGDIASKEADISIERFSQIVNALIRPYK